jgi:hypothetical protein
VLTEPRVKKFKFPLDRLRRWRLRQFELEEEKLRCLFDELRRLDEQTRELVRQDSALALEMVSRPEYDARDLIELDLWREFARREMQRLAATSRDLAARIEHQKQLALEAHRRVEMLDQLESRARNEWRARSELEMEQAVADLVLGRWNR